MLILFMIHFVWRASPFAGPCVSCDCGGAWPAESITHPSEVAKPPQAHGTATGIGRNAKNGSTVNLFGESPKVGEICKV